MKINAYTSHKKLLENAKSAMIAAIEIYNKPRFPYRENCVVILMINAWELLFKAILSKHKEKICHPKKRGAPLQGFSFSHSMNKAINLLGNTFPSGGKENLTILQDYRNLAMHYYSDPNKETSLYLLFQASIQNFRAVMVHSFSKKLEDDINWVIIPLGINPPVNIASYLSNSPNANSQLSNSILSAMKSLESQGKSTAGLAITLEINLISIKKAKNTNTKVAIVQGTSEGISGTIIEKQDPNISHPLRQKELLEQIKKHEKKKEGNQRKFTSYVLQAIVRNHKIKDNPLYCWTDSLTKTRRYSHDFVAYIKRLSKTDIEKCLVEYRNRNSGKRKK